MAALTGALGASAGDPPPVAEPAAGQLLVASERIRDPRFRRTVILLIRHDARGAFGVIINRPLGQRSIAELLSDPGSRHATSPKDAEISGTVRAFYGGPVGPERGFLIHSPDYRRNETVSVGDVALTATPEVLRDIGHGRGPPKFLFALGYAGWGAGQLAAEVARRDWFTAPADSTLIFDAERDAVWEKALARRIREM